MELLAVIIALETLRHPGSDVTLYTDSRYVADAVEKGWVFEWEKKRFRKKKNPDLWIRFLKSYRLHRVKFIWIKGHADHIENERCDRLAVLASRSDNIQEDEGYEQDSDPALTIETE
jgi:ribonuclease HI